MPNRKSNTGWYELPKSGTPYYGEVPEGAKTLTESEARKAMKADSGDDDGTRESSSVPA